MVWIFHALNRLIVANIALPSASVLRFEADDRFPSRMRVTNIL
jgi:hypothetical protein